MAPQSPFAKNKDKKRGSCNKLYNLVVLLFTHRYGEGGGDGWI